MEAKLQLGLILLVDKKRRVLGGEDPFPWKLPSFRSLYTSITMNAGVVIMGRSFYEQRIATIYTHNERIKAMEEDRAVYAARLTFFSDRRVIVLSGGKIQIDPFEEERIYSVAEPNAAIQKAANLAAKRNSLSACVIGGIKTFETFLPYIDRVHLFEVDMPEGVDEDRRMDVASIQGLPLETWHNLRSVKLTGNHDDFPVSYTMHSRLPPRSATASNMLPSVGRTAKTAVLT